MKSIKIGKRILILFPAVLLFSLFVFHANAKCDTPQTIRVGYYENEVFEEGASEGAVKTGYAYEYYRKLSEYTGWKYEYVYGSFGNLYDMLLDGKIDLLAGLAKREDRESLIGYPAAAMGNEIYTLVKHDDDSSVTYSPSSVSGKKIGVLKSAVSDVLAAYLSSNSISAEVITFDDYESLFDAFDTKKVDVLAAEGDGAYGREHAEVICSFGSSDYYLCVNISRPDLLDELNAAQSQLAAEEPGYINSLRNKYYSSSVSSHSFSTAEREWIAENTLLRIGYLNNYLPYSSTDSQGDATGIVKDIVPRILSELSVSGIEITYTGYDNYDEMINDMCSDRIDAAFPVGGGLYYSEESGIYQSVPVASTTSDLVYKDEYDDEDTRHFAVNENNRMQYYYIKNNYPDAVITMYPGIDACLEAILDGKAGATTLNGLRANEILKNSRYKGLYLKQLAQTDDRCFGVKIGNEGLLKLLNHGMNILGTEYAQDIAFIYADQLYSYTLSDMIRDNIWLFLTMLLIIAMMIILFIIRDLQRTRLSDRQKSDFVSNMSHEIRTPITAILGMNEMIQYESSDEAILKYSNNIEKAGESLLSIINDILDFSKIESGHMELSSGPYSLPELLSGLDLMIRMRAQEKGLGFSMVIDGDLPVMPVGDMPKIRQILTNLLTNAVKYTEKGDVTLTLKLISINDDSFTLEASVKDTGIGIKENEMDKLYSAFDRLDLEKTKHIEGSGLGLSITQRLLALMNSTIHVESTYGKGSVFSFSLSQGICDKTPIGPFEPAAAENLTGRKKNAPTFTAPGARLLVVDDTPMNLQVVCGLLKRNNMTIDTAGSGEKCLELFEKNDYDIVFLDQRMPNMDGIETLVELKKRFPAAISKTPVISLTANAFSTVKEQMLKAGFTDYLPKPVMLPDMEAMLLKYLPQEKIQMISSSDDKAGSCPDKTVLPKALGSIKMLDIESGIDYCGDEGDYLDALGLYSSSAGKKAGQLEKLLEGSDIEGFSLLIHSVKSTSRAIGAIKISEEAASLEKTAGENDIEGLRKDVPGFIERYKTLGQKIDEALAGSE